MAEHKKKQDGTRVKFPVFTDGGVEFRHELSVLPHQRSKAPPTAGHRTEDSGTYSYCVILIRYIRCVILVGCFPGLRGTSRHRVIISDEQTRRRWLPPRDGTLDEGKVRSDTGPEVTHRLVSG